MTKQYRSLRAQWLGKRLQKLRVAAGLTLPAAATAIDRDPTSVSRWENGASPIRSELLLHLLDLYGIKKRAERTEFLGLCDEVASHGWWDAYSKYLEPEFTDLLWIEENCTGMQQVEMVMMPGLLQSEAYAEALIRNDPDLSDDLQIRRLTELRMARQELHEQPHPPQVSVILYEAAVRQHVGGKQVMREQMLQLVETSAMKHVVIRLLPLESWAHAGTEASSGFTIFQMPAPYPQVGYAESSAGRAYLEEEQMPRIRSLYDRLAAEAMEPDATAKRMKALAKEYS